MIHRQLGLLQRCLARCPESVSSDAGGGEAANQ